MKKIKVIIATHKKYEMPSDKLYLPLHVGAEGKDKIGYCLDNKIDIMIIIGMLNGLVIT